MTRLAKRYGLEALLALLCVAFLVVGLALKSAADGANSAASKANSALIRIEYNEFQACHRLNVHRVIQDDRNSYREWLFDKYFLFALQHPLRNAKPAKGQQKVELEKFIDFLSGIVNSLTWTPATQHCANPGPGAVPIRFSVRQPQPSDLTLKPGE